MSADPVSAGRKGGASRSAAKLAACRRNGFQKVNKPEEESVQESTAPISQPTPKPIPRTLFAPRKQKEKPCEQ